MSDIYQFLHVKYDYILFSGAFLGCWIQILSKNSRCPKIQNGSIFFISRSPLWINYLEIGKFTNFYLKWILVMQKVPREQIFNKNTIVNFGFV